MNEKIYRVVWSKWRFVRLSMGAKTLLAFFLIVLVLAGGFYYFTNSTLTSQMEKEAFDELKLKTRAAWKLYYSRMDQMKLGMLQAASEEPVKAALYARDARFFQKLLSGYAINRPYVDLWAIVDEKGRVIARRSSISGDALDLNGLVEKAIKSNEALVSTEVVPKAVLLKESADLATRTESASLMQLAIVPVDVRGSVVGAIVTGRLLNNDAWIADNVNENFFISLAVFVVEGGGARPITSSTVPTLFSRGSTLSERVASRLSGSGAQAWREALQDGTDAYVSIEPIFGNDGKVTAWLATGLHSGHVNRHLSAMKRSVLLVAGVGAAFSFVLAAFSYRDTSRPIRALNRAMSDTAEGRMDVRVEFDTKDDFEEIGRGFNNMVESIRVRQQRLDRSNELAEVLIQSVDPEALVRRALNMVMDFSSSHLGIVYTWDESERLLKPFVSFGAGEGEIRPLKMGEGLAGKCALERRAVHIDDIDRENIPLDAGFLRILPGGLAWLPMTYKERLMGVLALGALKPFHEDELRHMEHLVTQIAIALDNALVHKENERLSMTDPLTGLYNRRYFFDRLKKELMSAIRYKHTLTLVMIDIDHFKSINDRFGHQQGDSVLSELAALLRDKTRVIDIWARYGGEEFIGFMSHISKDGSHILGEKVRTSVEQHGFAGMNSEAVTISVGVAHFPAEGVGSVDDLIKIADANLYIAKREGRNRVVA